jgi:hypothetical protein
MKLAESIIRLIESSLKDQIKKLYKVDDSAFEKASPEHSVHSIVKTKNGYAGYSHRTSCEFTPDKNKMIFDPEWNDNGKLSDEELDKMPFNKRGSKPCLTIDDAKQSAINFARYVS